MGKSGSNKAGQSIPEQRRLCTEPSGEQECKGWAARPSHGSEGDRGEEVGARSSGALKMWDFCLKCEGGHGEQASDLT